MEKKKIMICAETDRILKEMITLVNSAKEGCTECFDEWNPEEYADLCFIECTDSLIVQAQKYSEVHPEVLMVFYAEDSQSASKAFKAHPYDCLIKDDGDKEKRLKQAMMKIQKKEKFYVFSKKKTVAVLNCREIMYFYKTLNDLNICAQNQEYIQRKSMKSLNLPDYFYRISASLAVNLDYVSSVSDSRLTMKNGTHFDLSRQKSKEFRKVFYDYLSSSPVILSVC